MRDEQAMASGGVLLVHVVRDQLRGAPPGDVDAADWPAAPCTISAGHGDLRMTGEVLHDRRFSPATTGLLVG
jgi:hypothetical protein